MGGVKTPRLRDNHPRAIVETWSGRAIELHKGDLRRLENDRRGLSVICTEGILWITQEGDVKDYILEADQRYVIARRGSVVIQACGDARLRVAPPLEFAAAHSKHKTTRRN